MAKQWWIVQQSTKYSIVESDGPPDIEVPDGVKRKALRGARPTKSEAEKEAKKLAEFYHGQFVS